MTVSTVSTPASVAGEIMYGIDVSKPPPSSNVPAPPPTLNTSISSATQQAPDPSVTLATASPTPAATTPLQMGHRPPQAKEVTTATPSSAPNLPYPVEETFLKNHQHVRTSFLLDPSNNITPQGSLMHQEPRKENWNPAAASIKRAHNTMDYNQQAKKHC